VHYVPGGEVTNALKVSLYSAPHMSSQYGDSLNTVTDLLTFT